MKLAIVFMVLAVLVLATLTEAVRPQGTLGRYTPTTREVQQKSVPKQVPYDKESKEMKRFCIDVCNFKVDVLACKMRKCHPIFNRHFKEANHNPNGWKIYEEGKACEEACAQELVACKASC